MEVRRDIRLSVPSPRFLVVHYHIFKNGEQRGSHHRLAVQRAVRQVFATLHGPTSSSSRSVLAGEPVRSFQLKNNPDISAISSHHLRYPKPVIPGAPVFDCCFLRDPLERIQSFYTYFKKINSSDLFGRLARQESPQGFVNKLMDTSPHLISNVQVTLLANGGVFTQPQ